MELDYNALMAAGMDLGRQLLKNGAEVYRVEESMTRFFGAYGVAESELIVLTTYINVTLLTEEKASVTQLCRVADHTNDLFKVDRLNDLCRRACACRPPLSEVRGELAEIAAGTGPSYWTRVLGCVGVAFASTLFFGGGLLDALISGFAGFCLQWVLYTFEKYKANAFFVNLISSAVIAVIATLAGSAVPGLQTDKIIIGALMNLVPGVAITSFMRDLLSRDYLSGTLRFVESMLVAAAIALGTGSVLALSRIL